MRTSLLKKADNWINSTLRYPGIEEREFTLRKDSWLAALVLAVIISILTLMVYLVDPRQKLLIAYGLFQITLKFILLAAGIWHKRDLSVVLFFNQVTIAVVTFVFVLLLGGIPTSGGLILVGLFQVFFSFDFRKKRNTYWLISIYISTVIASGLLHPYLEVPDHFNPSLNVTLFVINLSWLTIFALVFVMNFIKQALKMEKMKSARIKELEDVKTRLFTNITHEFRNPLTIIMSMIELMGKKPEETEKAALKIGTNVKILLHFINQMLDISKIDRGAMPIYLVQSDVILFLKMLTEHFFSVASEKNILLKFSSDRESLFMDYDPEKLMHIFTNILSNALKYTQRGGYVHVTASLYEIEKPGLELRIADNGPGIPEEALPHLFDRFYRVESSSSHTAVGTGLGLAITKELVQLMDGTVKVESIPGEGTEFIVRLPVRNTVKPVTEPDINGFTEIISPVVAHHAQDMYIPDFNLPRGDDKPLLLVAEDNSDVVRYLETILGEKYCIEAASDGKEALGKALELIPDIVIADIMMPVMDGIELTRIIKEDMRTSHIPVLILSARGDVESRIEGLSRGADAYLSKPFSSEELKVILSNLLDLRKKLRNRYTSVADFHNTHDKDTLLEDSFMNRIRRIMESNIMDENFDIKKLCNELAMSRTQLYRKFRTLTDMTVSQYMQHLRLHKAKALITQNDVRVSDAAYQTGFKNLSHFSRAFTEEFGTNPSKIRKKAPEGGIS